MLVRLLDHSLLQFYKSTYYYAISTVTMLVFINIPERGCISGNSIPSLATHMGRLGALNDPFPDSGVLAVRIGAAWSVSYSCCFWEFCPLESTIYGSRNHNSTWTRTILRVWFGGVAALCCVASSEAQTYYYYPSSGTNAPGVMAAPATAPTYSYRRGLFGRLMRSTYTPQVYQSTVVPQTYQPAIAAPDPGRGSARPDADYADCSCFVSYGAGRDRGGERHLRLPKRAIPTAS